MIEILYTGSDSYNTPQTQPNKSLGGFVSSSKVLNNKLHTIFQQETYRSLSDKKSEYICLVLKFPSGSIEDVLIGLRKLNDNTNYSIVLGFSELSQNFDVEKISDRYTEPYDVVFQNEVYAEDDDDVNNMFDIGSRTTDKYIAVWIKRDLNKVISAPEDLCELDPQILPIQTQDGFELIMRYTNTAFCEPLFANGREVSYLSLINEISLSGSGTSDLSLSLVDAQFTDLESVIQQVPIYTTIWGDASTQPIGLGGSITHDVSSYADGGYIGKITENNSGAECEFWYSVENGLITALTTKRETHVTVTLTCGLYPNYPIVMTDECSVSGSNFIESSMKLFNSTIQNSSYASQTQYNNSATMTTNFSSTNYEILAENSITDYDSGTIHNKGVLRTRGIA